MQAWRITRQRFADTAFFGNGAADFPGRWNDYDEPMVYCAGSLALAALELLVNIDPDEQRSDLVFIEAHVPDDSVHVLDPARLPGNWRRFPRPMELPDIGSHWLKSRASLAFVVPSAVIPLETLVLINPLHERVSELRLSAPVPFEFDTRLLGR